VKVKAPTRTLVRGSRGVVACGHPVAALAGLELLRQGGNAVDAALAAAGALSVLLPDACGLGGDALLLVREPDGSVTAINGSGAAPRDLPLPIPEDGTGTTAVPGAVAAWATAAERFGRLGLGEALVPAAELAREGFPVGERLIAAVADHRRRLERGAPGWELLRGLRPGQIVRLPRLAGLLERIGREGPSAFYMGEIPAAVERATSREGGGLSAADLSEHQTTVREPLRSRYRDAALTLQPPVSQAVLLAMALKVLQKQGEGDRERRTHLAVEALEAAFAHRDSVAVPGAEEWLLGAQLEVDGERATRRGGPKGYSHTTAVTAADSDGTVVSMLVSVFDDFGCATLVPEGGFLLNDRMLGFSRDPRSPNAARPCGKPVHTLSPILLEEGGRTIALATPGADGQVQTLLQVVTGLLDDHLELQAAIEAPRWRSIEARLAVEGGLDLSTARSLVVRGHDAYELPAGHGLFGAVAAAGIDAGTGTLFAATDPRREVWAAGW
jgi:gamma-glutamyltranspeptidase/glutathione hydrolase